MDLNYSPEDRAFRETTRRWLEANVPRDDLKTLAAHAFQHAQRDVSVDLLLQRFGAHAYPVLSRSRVGPARQRGHVRLHAGRVLREVEGAGLSFRFAREGMSGKTHPIMTARLGSAYRSFGPLTVPAGEYFMMGDNRDNSTDSRVRPDHGGVGYVPSVNLVGRADFLFFSHNGEARFWEIWNWPFAIRYERMFSTVK